MEKLTKKRIEEMANDIANYCYKNNYGDVILYYNNKRRFIDYYGHERDEIQENINPHDYMEYVAYDHILSISSEGGLDLEHEAFYVEKGGIEEIFNKYGCYSELGTGWYTSLYPEKSDMEVEYTIYDRPRKTHYIYRHNLNEFLPELQKLIEIFDREISNCRKTNSCCVIGDGIKFDYKDKSYFFSTNYNQSESPSEVISSLKRYLFSIGAENIKYNCGIID